MKHPCVGVGILAYKYLFEEGLNLIVEAEFLKVESSVNI